MAQQDQPQLLDLSEAHEEMKVEEFDSEGLHIHKTSISEDVVVEQYESVHYWITAANGAKLFVINADGGNCVLGSFYADAAESKAAAQHKAENPLLPFPTRLSEQERWTNPEFRRIMRWVLQHAEPFKFTEDSGSKSVEEVTAALA